MHANQADEMTKVAEKARDAAARVRQSAEKASREAFLEKSRARARADIPRILQEIETLAKTGERRLSCHTGHSEDHGAGAAYGGVLRDHMVGLGYKANFEAHEPCNEGQTETTHYWVFSW